MLWRIRSFFRDEYGGIVDTIVTIGLLVIIVGGVLYVLNGGMQDVGNAVEKWICEHLPKACA